MEFTSEAERQGHQAARVKIYNDLQMVLAGNPLLPALEAMCDCVAVSVVMAAGSDRAKAHELLDRLLPDMKMTADNNLDLVAEQISRAGNVAGAGNS